MCRCALFLSMFFLFFASQQLFSQNESTLTTTETAEGSSGESQQSFTVIDQKFHGEIRDWLLEQDASLGSASIITMGFEDNPVDATGKNLAVIILGADNQPEKRLFSVETEFYQRYSGTEEGSSAASQGVDYTTPVSAQVTSEVAGDPQDGRLYFMINTTSRSAFVYPMGIATTMENSDYQVTLGLSLLSIGASLYGSYAFSRSLELGYGRVEFMNYGGDIGGIWIPQLLQFAFAPEMFDNDEKVRAIGGMIGFPLGIFIGSRLPFVDNHAYGNASMMTNLSRSAPLYGYGIMALATNLENEDDFRIGSALSLAFIPAGFYIGKKIVGNQDIASGRSILTLTAGIGGAISGPLIVSLFEYDNSDLYFAGAMLGHIGGSFLGFNYRSHLEHTFSQGVFTAVSSAVGIGLGLSLPLLASADDHQAYTTAAILGCWGGFFLGEYLSLSLFEKSRHDNRGSSVSVSFPGLASLPFFILQQKFTGENSHTTATPDPRMGLPSHATLMEMRF